MRLKLVSTALLASGLLAGLLLTLDGRVPVSRAVADGPSVIATIDLTSTGETPFGVAVNPNTNRVYIGNVSSNNVVVVDGSTNAIVGTISLPPPVPSAEFASPVGIAVDSTRNRIYVNQAGNNTLLVFDGLTDALLATVSIGDYPWDVAVNPITNRIYSVDFNGVSVVDGASDTLLATVPMIYAPIGVAVDAITNSIYVASSNACWVGVINGDTNIMTQTAINACAWGVAVNPLTNRIYTANNGNNDTCRTLMAIRMQLWRRSLLATNPSA